MSPFKELKEFAMKGNVVDLAVGVIIGAAFGKIVSSMVNGVLMPTIVAFCIFMVIKVMNSMKKPAPVAPAALSGPTKEEKLMTEIRDVLKARA